jgi:hypothetical protein
MFLVIFVNVHFENAPNFIPDALWTRLNFGWGMVNANGKAIEDVFSNHLVILHSRSITA